MTIYHKNKSESMKSKISSTLPLLVIDQTFTDWLKSQLHTQYYDYFDAYDYVDGNSATG